MQDLNKRLRTAKDDNGELDKLISEYKPFIASCTKKFTGRYVNYGEDDELSVAMMAFVEAVKSYDDMKGNFLTFTQNVIKRRLIDYSRKEARHANNMPLDSANDNDSEGGIDYTISKSIDVYNEQVNNYSRQEEIQELKKELSLYEIDFFELAQVTPKHEKLKQEAISIIRFIMEKPEFIRHIKEKKTVPASEISKYLKLPRKKTDRLRKYIIAVIIILTGDYKYIREYVDWGVVK